MRPNDADERALPDSRTPGVPMTARPPAYAPPFPAVVRPHALRSAPNAFDLLRALRRRWRFAAFAATLMAALAAAVTWTMMPPPHYSTYALLRISSAPPML